ncbi:MULTISPECIES: glycolate oxidase subunit GlcF [unclassified Sphingobium]|uniref:glycolate oxidase subunit GlcF n=1 Tax=unclassified Sphingobium TaxID=2611147 RepID=UPI002224EC10|nr:MULTISPECIES: glycolate oxidase subunit GlcF [unclassified Sphingobium]MCW2394607.1 glycolate oxidase iron-sulfur subunit [Sphingobium sp. B8D3B]MCW2418121.1 glycolate oxidase iron-sulfur subunit [Sphingobium sp. B8D3C]
MRTDFTAEQLADPAMAASERAIRKCVHCGFCTATCPTYVLLGDERDSPRGRIYMMQDMLQNERVPSGETVRHIDRCLSCLSCMTTCPSGVNYMHLVDHARSWIATHYRRPWHERLMRRLLGAVLPHPRRLALALRLAPLGRPFAPLLARWSATRPLAAMLRLAPSERPTAAGVPPPAIGNLGRVILLQGCAEPALKPNIRAATHRLLSRAGYEVLFANGEVCCGALVRHMGQDAESLNAARRNVDAWTPHMDAGLKAIIITASGCGTTIKDYGFMLRDDPLYAERAARLSALACDISEFLAKIALPRGRPQGIRVAYQSACSLLHGQSVDHEPRALLERAGYEVATPAEPHLCCGSAGTYNILQPEISAQLRDRKVATLRALQPDVIATGNIGCAMQIGSATDIPVLHIVELLDRALGGADARSIT